MLLPTSLLVLLASRFASSAPIAPPLSRCIEGYTCRPSLHHAPTSPHALSLSPFSTINDLLAANPTSKITIIHLTSSTPDEALSVPKPESTLHLTSLAGNPSQQREQSLYLLKEQEKERSNPNANGDAATAAAKANENNNIHLHELPPTALANFWTSEHASRGGAHPPSPWSDHGGHRGHGGPGRYHGRHGHGGRRREEWIYLPGNIYIKSTHYISRRPDVAVIGIILAFLSMVVCIEAAGWIADSLRRALGCKCQARGPIYLEGDEKFPSLARRLSVRHFHHHHHRPASPPPKPKANDDEESESALEHV